MTLCVAANCRDKGRPMTVIAADLTVEGVTSTAEIENKVHWVGDRPYPTLISGSGSRAEELLDHMTRCGNEAKGKVKTRGEFLTICRETMRRHKHSLADEYISAKLGISYDKLLGSLHSSLPAETYRGIMNDVGRMKLGCDVIVVFFEWEHGEPMIVRMNDEGELEICSNFAAIGSGVYIAESALFHREHTEDSSLADTLYRVYEAMRLGAHAPGVGEKFHMYVTYSAKKRPAIWKSVGTEYRAKLKEEFGKWGPRPVPSQILMGGMLETVTVAGEPQASRGRRRK